MYQVTEDELTSLHNAGNYKTLDIALFALCAGVLVTVAATLLTVDMKPGLVFQGFIALLFTSGAGTLFFAGRARIAWREARQELARIKRSEID